MKRWIWLAGCLLLLTNAFAQYHYPPQPDGALGNSLTRKRIYISPGHGYYYNFNPPGYWTTQRSEINGYIEDIGTNEIVMDYLSRYLYNAGAQVFICRERSRQTNEIIINNDAGAPYYIETGTWYTSSYTGYNGVNYRYTFASVSETATARWTPNIPQEGYYPVYVWYRAGTNRITNAKFRIKHSGGITDVIVNQQEFDMRWIWLGEFHFEAGTSGYVELSNQSNQSGVVIANAVRFGAGYGSIPRNGVTSQQPRWKEAARYWLEYMGAPSTVYDYYTGGTDDKNDDVMCRPEYADWQGGDAYISIHTNAFDGTASGTETYIHDTNPSPGSNILRNKVHTQVINDIKALWDSAWIDRGEKAANFGELREANTMPAILIEIAFHDNLSKDNPYLQNQAFRDIVSRAIYKGIVRYFNASAAILPLPPSNLQLQDLGGGNIKLTWSATLDTVEGSIASPSGYKIYKSTNGKGFDNGINVGNTTEYIYSGFQPGTHWFYVSAYNAGGESLPSTKASITLIDNTPPSQPGQPVASPNPNSGNFTLTWAASSDDYGIVKYVIYRSPDPTGPWDVSQAIVIDITTNSYSFTNHPQGTWYFRIKAKDNSNNASWSEVGSVVVDNTPPSQPGQPVASPNPNSGNFTLSWTASSDDYGIVKYVIYRSADPAGPWDASQAIVIDITTNSYSFTNHPQGTWYFRIKAKDNSNNASWSEVSSAVEVTSSQAGGGGGGGGGGCGGEICFESKFNFFLLLLILIFLMVTKFCLKLKVVL